MKTRNLILLLASHGLIGAAGFAAGIYVLPILIAPPAPSAAAVSAVAESAAYTFLFYTSDAADDMQFVHLGCRRIIKNTTDHTIVVSTAHS